jgi:hypothetical protein
VFGYIFSDATGLMSLELNPWTDLNTRRDSLVYANGFLCKASDLTRRYLGSVYIGGTAGLLQDWGNYQGISGNPAKRFIWNLYNRVRRDSFMFDSTINWAITSDNQWRVIDNLVPPQGCLELFRGFDDDLVEVTGMVNCNLAATGNYYSAIGLDSNNPIPSSSIYGSFNNTTNKALNIAVTSTYSGRPGIGYHTIRLLERLASGTATGGSDSQSGLLGVVFS